MEEFIERVPTGRGRKQAAKWRDEGRVLIHACIRGETEEKFVKILENIETEGDVQKKITEVKAYLRGRLATLRDCDIKTSVDG